MHLKAISLEDDDAADLRLPGKWADLLPSVPAGKNYLYFTERGGGAPLFGWRQRYRHFLLKLLKEQPSWTLTAQPGPATGPFHWKSRRLAPVPEKYLQLVGDHEAHPGTGKGYGALARAASGDKV